MSGNELYMIIRNKLIDTREQIKFNLIKFNRLIYFSRTAHRKKERYS